MGLSFCKNCGAEISDELAGKCPKCGAARLASGLKNPVIAAVLSLFIPGLGQSYNGNALKGFGIFLGIAILLILTLVVSSEGIFIVILLVWAAGVYDAYRDAGLMNSGKIPEKKQQVLLFGGVAIAVVLILAVVFAMFFFYLAFYGLAGMNATVVCIPGKGCISPLEGEAACNTTSQCIGSAQTRIEVRYYSDAIKFLDRALALEPDNAHALTLMGVARAKSGNLTGAIIPLDRAVIIDPNLSAAWENRGIVQAMSGKTAASRTDLEKAVTLPGNSSLSWYNLWVAQSLAKNASKAVDAFDNALLIDNNCTSCQLMKGKSLIALGQYDAALDIFTSVNESGLMGIKSRQEEGNALAALKRYQESCSAFDAAIDAYPFYAADIWSGVCNETTSRCEPLRVTAEPRTDSDREFNIRVLAEYDDQLKTRQNDFELWIKRGEILIELMRYDEAVTSFERSISIKPQNTQALNKKGVALFYKGEHTLALQAFDQAVITDPESIKPWNNGAFVFVKQEKYANAAKAYQKALYIASQQTVPEGGDFIFETAF